MAGSGVNRLAVAEIQDSDKKGEAMLSALEKCVDSPETVESKYPEKGKKKSY